MSIKRKINLGEYVCKLLLKEESVAEKAVSGYRHSESHDTSRGSHPITLLKIVCDDSIRDLISGEVAARGA